MTAPAYAQIELKANDPNPKGLWQYTGSAGFIYENADIQGDAAQSGYDQGTALFGKLKLRGEYETDKAKASFHLSAVEPLTDLKPLQKQFQFTANYSMAGNEWAFGDISPRLSPWTLSGKRLFGLDMVRRKRGKQLFLIAAKYKKYPNADPGDDYVVGAGHDWLKSADYALSSEFVVTQEKELFTGMLSAGKNQVLLNRFTFTPKSGVSVEVTYATSRYKNSGNPTTPQVSGDAFKVALTLPAGPFRLKTSFEDVDDGFMSLGGYAASGRRVAISEISAPIGHTATVKGGFSVNETDTQSISTIPWSLTLKPFGKKTTLVLDHNSRKSKDDGNVEHGRTRGASIRTSTGNTAFIVGMRSDHYGSGMDVSTILYFDATSRLSDNLQMRFKTDRENRKSDEDPRETHLIGVDWDLSDWSSLSISQEIRSRLSGNTVGKNAMKAGLKYVNPVNDLEFAINYKIIRDRDHKDFVLSMESSYGF